MLGTIVGAIIGIFFSAFCLWAGMKITKVDGSFIAMLVVATISGAVGLFPVFGWILGTIIMFVLICKLTDANFWPDAVLMVVVARCVNIVAVIFLGGLLH